MSASAYALRREVEMLRHENAELRAYLVSANYELLGAQRDLALLRLPFFRRWRMRRKLRRDREAAAKLDPAIAATIEKRQDEVAANIAKDNTVLARLK